MSGLIAWRSVGRTDIRLRAEVLEDVSVSIELLRLGTAAAELGGLATGLERAVTEAERESAHSLLHTAAGRLSERLDALSGADNDRLLLDGLRGPVSSLDSGGDELNRRVARRLAIDRELRARRKEATARAEAFSRLLSSLPPGDGRRALEELGWTLAGALLEVAGDPEPGGPRTGQPERGDATGRRAAVTMSGGMAAVVEGPAPRSFRDRAARLSQAIADLPVDPDSARRAEAGRRLVALGLERGGLFDLRDERARAAAAAAALGDTLRAEAADVVAACDRLSLALRNGALVARGRILAPLALAPLAAGLVTAFAVLVAATAAAVIATRRAVGTPGDIAVVCRPAGGAAPAPPPALRILLAEDEPVSQLAAAALLRRAGHTVTIAGDGVAALEAAEAATHDLALLDLRMPRLDGLEVARRLAARPDGERPRIVMLTASALPEEREQALACGADAVLAKPLRLGRLQPVLDRLFGGAAARPFDAPWPESDSPAGAALFGAPLFEAPIFEAPIFEAEVVERMREQLTEERVATLVEGAVRALRDYHAMLGEAWLAGDRAAASALAHKIAGVAGLYGCLALHRAAQSVERALERPAEGDTAGSDVDDAWRRLDATAGPSLDALERAVRPQEA